MISKKNFALNKAVSFCFLLILMAFLTSFKTVKNKPFAIRTVVIDAGHGGHDYGCLGSTTKEKNIALEVSLKLGELIEKNYPEVKVIYTRKTDVFVELHERAGIANRAKADLFICIHCNSACVRDAGSRKETCNESIHGPETYVMGLHKTDDNLAVSRRENSAILLEKDYKTKYDGFDPNSPEANIIFTLFQNAFMNQSISFASKIQTEFEEYSGRVNRGVKQAGFLVLYRTTMPSVLIETGFLTNKNEEKYLASEKGQNDVANSIFRAFKGYKVDLENESPLAEVSKTAPSKQNDNSVNINKESEKPVAIEIKKDSVTEEKKRNVSANGKDTTAGINGIVKPDTIKKINVDSTFIPLPVAVKTSPKSGNNLKKENKTSQPEIAPDFYYTVQIGAAQNVTSQVLQKYAKVDNLSKIIGEDGITRFTSGKFQNLNEAINMQSALRSKGFKDAYVTAYKNKKRISLKEADEFLKKK